MKKLKKLFAVLLTLTMVLGMTATVFAENDDSGDGTPSGTVSSATGKNMDAGTITVEGIGANSEVYAFQIVKANYGGTNGMFSGYEAVYNGITFANNSFTKEGAELAKELAAVQAGFTYTANTKTWTGQETSPGKVTLADGYTTMSLSQSGAYTAEVPVGSYLIVVKNEGTSLYSPIVVSVSYVTDGEGATDLEEGNINIRNGQAWVKVTSDPTVTKTATVPDRNSSDDNADSHSVNVGDTVSYAVNINEVPNYTGANPVFNVVDTLSTGLSYVVDEDEDVELHLPVVAVSVKKGEASAVTLTKGTNYWLSFNEDGNLVVDFVKTEDNVKTYGLKDYAGYALTITYQAKVTSSAAMNFDSNNNAAKLNYVKDSTLNAEDPDNTGDKESKTYNYTFDLSTIVNGSETENTSFLWKSGDVSTTSETKTVPLEGAIFTLYTDANCSSVYNANNALGNTFIPNGTVTSGVKGQLEIKGLAAGTYYLKETEAPAGYSLNNTVYKIEIKATYHEEGNMLGQLKAWSVKLTDKDKPLEVLASGTLTTSETKINAYEIINTKLASLPSTGGIGTTIFTIGGCALMIIAAGLYFASRRRTAR